MNKSNKNNGMKFLTEDAVNYIRYIWGFDSAADVDDMAMFWGMAEYEMVALRLVEAGAVEPNCKQAREIIRVAKSISQEEQNEIIDKCLKMHTVLECSNCNHVHFIPPYCDAKDWINGKCESCDKKGYVKEVSKCA